MLEPNLKYLSFSEFINLPSRSYYKNKIKIYSSEADKIKDIITNKYLYLSDNCLTNIGFPPRTYKSFYNPSINNLKNLFLRIVFIIRNNDLFKNFKYYILNNEYNNIRNLLGSGFEWVEFSIEQA